MSSALSAHPPFHNYFINIRIILIAFRLVTSETTPISLKVVEKKKRRKISKKLIKRTTFINFNNTEFYGKFRGLFYFGCVSLLDNHYWIISGFSSSGTWSLDVCPGKLFTDSSYIHLQIPTPRFDLVAWSRIY